MGFDATIGGGTGANGMTLTFASPTSTTLLGEGGGSLGYSGISGVAVGLANFKQGADPSGNFVGIADGGPVSGIPKWVAINSGIPTLQGGTTHVQVTVNGTQLTVGWVGSRRSRDRWPTSRPPPTWCSPRPPVGSPTTSSSRT